MTLEADFDIGFVVVFNSPGLVGGFWERFVLMNGCFRRVKSLTGRSVFDYNYNTFSAVRRRPSISGEASAMISVHESFGNFFGFFYFITAVRPGS